VFALYKISETFGGQYDDARDSKSKLDTLSSLNPHKILVAEKEETIVGTVSIFEDGRAAWLYRFALQKDNEEEISEALYKTATQILKDM
jgi:hypothetical protein